MLFPSLAAGAAAGHVLRTASLASRAAVLLGLATVSGLVAAGIADGLAGLGHYWGIAGIVALFSLATSAPTAALGQVRPPLIALAVLTFVVFGIPASGGPANFAAFGPGFLRWLSPVLPLGVATSAVRNTIYFHGADTTAHLWALTAFAAAGLAGLWGLNVTRNHKGGTNEASRHRRERSPRPGAAAARHRSRPCRPGPVEPRA